MSTILLKQSHNHVFYNNPQHLNLHRLAGLNISQSLDLNRLLYSCHRDKPKSSRNLPKWNLSVVLDKLTKVAFEPMKNTDLKHLTFKTALLLSFGLWKCRSEKPYLGCKQSVPFGPVGKGRFIPFFKFHSQNQLAREGSQSVSPVIIPALTIFVDRQFNEDRTQYEL